MSSERVFEVVVTARTPAAASVDLFDLSAADGSPLPDWTPGSHIDVLLAAGGERQYSLLPSSSSGTDAPGWRIGVLNEPAGRGGSAWLHSLSIGSRLRVRGPRNHFAFEPVAGTSYLFLAAGIGITPIAGMAEAAATAGVDYELHYSGRSRESMALVDELTGAHTTRVVVHASDAGSRLDLDALLSTLDPATVIYACGPAHFLTAVEAAAGDHPLHVERFAAKELGEPVFAGEFEVELDDSGITVTVRPDQSILEAVEESGVFVLSSCREGTCGTCETPVLEGEVEHRDSILTPEEQARNDVMYICVSRAACPRLVLDL
jgi:ferredoxin-NADP reductase